MIQLSVLIRRSYLLGTLGDTVTVFSFQPYGTPSLGSYASTTVNFQWEAFTMCLRFAPLYFRGPQATNPTLLSVANEVSTNALLFGKLLC